MEECGSVIPHFVHSHPSIESPPERHRMTFLRAYSCHQKEGNTSNKMYGLTKHGKRRELIYWCSGCETEL
jgi:hypothetical protein